MKSVYYRGTTGAYSSLAAYEALGQDIELKGVDSFKAVVEQVQLHPDCIGILPIQNSISGSIRETYDLLRKNDLKIIQEVVIPIRHAWMTRPDTAIEEIAEVMSHPEALYQCQDFIQANGLKAVEGADTASCARLLSQASDSKGSVIAHADVAAIYGLKILARDVQTEDLNQTRFIVFGHQEAESKGPKLSVYLEVENQRGALYQVISQLVHKQVNIISIESRPLQSRPFDIGFFFDLMLEHPTDFKSIAYALEPHTLQLSVLGQYDAFVQCETA